MTGYLESILAWHRAASPWCAPAPELVEAAEQVPAGRDFAAALAGGDLAVIAEIKRRSPSAGDIAATLDPATLAGQYTLGGAAAISVLTDAEFFGGSSEDLRLARSAVELPVLRKDFTVSPSDIYQARLMGADAVLLIVAALTEEELVHLVHLATQLGLAALVEAHDSEDLKRAQDAGAALVGINQRDLKTFALDHHRAEELASEVGPGVLKVAESGIRHPDDAARLASAGFDAVLVGESLLRQADPAAATREMVRAGTRLGALRCS